MSYVADVARARAQGSAARAARARHAAGDAALRRRDLRRLPLRAARPARRDLAASGLLWVAIVFTALLGLGRAFVPEREQRTFDGLVLAPCDRSAIWLAKSLATLAFLVAAEVVALPALRALLPRRRRRDGRRASSLADIGICAVGTLLGAMAVVDAGARPAAAAALPAARDPDRDRRRRRERRRLAGPLPRLPRALRRCSSRCSAGPRSSTSSPSDDRGAATMAAVGRTLPHLPARARRGLARARHDARSPSSSSSRRTTPTRASRSGSSTSTSRSRSRRTSASGSAPGRRSSTSGSATRTPTSRATSRSTRA